MKLWNQSEHAAQTQFKKEGHLQVWTSWIWTPVDLWWWFFLVSVKTPAGHVSAPHGKHPKVFLKVPTPSASEALLLLSAEITLTPLLGLFDQKDVSSCIRLAALLFKPHHSATYEAELFNPDLSFKWSLERKKKNYRIKWCKLRFGWNEMTDHCDNLLLFSWSSLNQCCQINMTDLKSNVLRNQKKSFCG